MLPQPTLKKMAEDVKNLELEDLFDLLMQSTRELIGLENTENKEEYEAKIQEVKLLQRIIGSKNADHKPG